VVIFSDFENPEDQKEFVFSFLISAVTKMVSLGVAEITCSDFVSKGCNSYDLTMTQRLTLNKLVQNMNAAVMMED
jgi:hypothetical protein